jgi:hypothetical protein
MRGTDIQVKGVDSNHPSWHESSVKTEAEHVRNMAIIVNAKHSELDVKIRRKRLEMPLITNLNAAKNGHQQVECGNILIESYQTCLT